ncbi:tetraacyldisaccharide 4'-kinase [Gynuella sunshinyii]|uniref:Tetraacyldisaccharide 4'-kinase n=1 Tax=Gynuella sunshinyii YC6258 TaxID=1445510 RepID=A0A0C5VR08_9GAMM|nr:tetraacyldisaccharide 4'-kinase [Gynuella sunshinyii]AJQ95833.1 tetraacyldisaccharide-1-P 4'-kinase [Gynuella sunshinyii YC6258]
MLVKHWYRNRLTWLTFLLLPLEVLYKLISQRKSHKDKLKSRVFRCPLVVVGNITVGGTGKTPFIIYLSHLLSQHQYRVGIVSRGYGGRGARYPLMVTAETDVEQCGDEPKLIANATGVPVCVSPNRNEAVDALLQQHELDIVLSDDGLQHYKMHRDYEIVLLDAQRGWGNGHRIPSGPLRESIRRLDQVNQVYIKQAGAAKRKELDCFPSFRLVESQLLSVTGCQARPDSQQVIHAVAGIAHPEPFFEALEQLGYRIIRHVFADHHHFTLEDFAKFRDSLIIMTEKDWVKCCNLSLRRVWVVRISVKLDSVQEQHLLTDMRQLIVTSRTENNA